MIRFWQETYRRMAERISSAAEPVIAWLKGHSLPGFFGVPIWDIAQFLHREVQQHDPFMRASAVAFNFFLSLFPAMITLFTLLPYIPLHESFSETLHGNVRGLLPGTAGDWLVEFLNDIATKERRGLLSFGTLLFLYFSTSGTATLIYSFEKEYPELFKNRHPLMVRWIAMWLTALLGVLVVVSISLTVAGGSLIYWTGEFLRLDWFAQTALETFRWVLVVSLFYSSIALLYRYGAPTHRKFGFFSTGATVATLMAILSSVGFSFYINAFGTYNQLYGSIGTIIVLMLWLQINAFSIISGYELNAAILYHRLNARLRPESAKDQEGFDHGA